MSKLEQLFQETSALAEDNAGFLETLYEQFLDDPQSVDAGWREHFRSIQTELGATDAKRQPATIEHVPVVSETALRKQAAVAKLIEQFRARGHLAANNNPLRLSPPELIADLDPARYGLTDADLDRPFYFDVLRNSTQWPLRDIIERLRRAYCGSLAIEYRHIVDSEIQDWLQSRLEQRDPSARLKPERKTALLKLLTAAEGIETYLHRKYVGQKRFSLEGAESLIPLLDEVLERSARLGSQEIVIGMAHRGRLNVLVNILGKRPSLLFQEFEGKVAQAPANVAAGDVKYHMGFSADIETESGSLHLTLAFNPSHLEIINPVVEGSVRARQERRNDGETAVVPVLIHGDAAFAGQGVVMETLNMAETRAYTTGGTVHVVVNNQIGFTTSNPFDMRSTLYCTDVANMVQAPVLHVNGDDPEAVLQATALAVDFRMRFKRDVVIDLICYRRHGHNEADEPAVTQPAMYRFIRQHPSVRAIYAQQLVREGLVSEADVEDYQKAYQDGLASDHVVSRRVLGDATNYSKTRWDRYMRGVWTLPADTRVPLERLRGLAEKLLDIPGEVSLHSRTAAIMDTRRKSAAGEIPLDWGHAENLAYASLIQDGYNVRLTGQDVGRGTFFHRHAIIYDQNSGAAYIPLQNFPDAPGRFQIFDSILSEEGVLGFEYGFSSSDPDTLVIWEAQFGDFANNAQVVIDQFIASGETKWGRLSGLTMLLPHGYEGQGPEHSSARPERYLQLCAEQNIQVCMPTTPAQIYHLLRRQMVRACRKPLIVMSPKSLLRHKLAVSSLEELAFGGFQNVIDEVDPIEAEAVTKAVLCSGKIFYELLDARRRTSLTDTVIIRIEQLYPFPIDEFKAILDGYPNLRHLVWCQEEPENQGAWHQIKHRFLSLLEKNISLRYAGRPMSAAPAVGHYQRHVEQQQKVVEDALFGSVGVHGST